MGSAPQADLRDYLAAERTLLAWIRTGLALMGFGFVVARFGLFLQQMQFVQHLPVPHSYGLSLWFGTAMIVVGVLVNLFAGWHHVRLVRDLDAGQTHSRPSHQAVIVAVLLALIGLGMAVYLLSARSSTALPTNASGEIAMTLSRGEGLVTIPSNHSVDQTVEKFKGILEAKGITLFALVDHSGEAEKVQMKMPATKLLIFGNPKGGTPVMLAAPSIAIDLPLKILVWEDGAGKVWISYNSPAYLQSRHGVPEDLLKNISVVEALATQAGA